MASATCATAARGPDGRRTSRTARKQVTEPAAAQVQPAATHAVGHRDDVRHRDALAAPGVDDDQLVAAEDEPRSERCPPDDGPYTAAIPVGTRARPADRRRVCGRLHPQGDAIPSRRGRDDGGENPAEPAPAARPASPLRSPADGAPAGPSADARRADDRDHVSAVSGCTGRWGRTASTSSGSSPCASSCSTSRSAASGATGSGAPVSRDRRLGEEQRRRRGLRPRRDGRGGRAAARVTASAARTSDSGRPSASTSISGTAPSAARTRCSASIRSGASQPPPRTTSARSVGVLAHVVGQLRPRLGPGAAGPLGGAHAGLLHEGLQQLLVEPVRLQHAVGADGVQRVLEAARPGVAEVEPAVLLVAEQQLLRGPLPHGRAGGDEPAGGALVVRLVGHADRPRAGLGDQFRGPLPEHLAGEQPHPVDVEHALHCPSARSGVFCALRESCRTREREQHPESGRQAAGGSAPSAAAAPWKRVSPGLEVTRRSPPCRLTTIRQETSRPEAGALPDGLGREERLEHPAAQLLGDARAGVGDLHHRAVAVRAGAQGQRALRRAIASSALTIRLVHTWLSSPA